MHNLINYIRAGYPGIYLISSEEVRVEHELKRIAEKLDRALLVWSFSEGFVNLTDKQVTPAAEPVDALTTVADIKGDAIVLLKDFHFFFEESNPLIVRQTKEA